MKSRNCFIILSFVFLLTLPFISKAQDLNSNPTTKWFIGVGGNMGMESLEIKRFGGGASLPFGYHINSNLSVYGLTDFFITKRSQVNYAFVSFTPMVTYRFYKWFSVYGGVGYTFMHTSNMGRLWDFRPSAKNNYHGLKTEFGFGYNPQVSKRVFVSPQIGVQYTRIASDNLLIPVARVNIILNL